MQIIHLLFVINFFELLAAVLATIYYPKYVNTKEKYFLYFLWYVVLTDTYGAISAWIFEKNSMWIYILFFFFSYLFYFCWYYSILVNKRQKKIMLSGILIFLIIAFFDFFTQSWEHNHIKTYITGSIITVVGSFMFFSEVLNSNQVLNVKNKLGFWISVGLLLFNVGLVPFTIYSKTFDAEYEFRTIILVGLNVILYTCYSLGFIWMKKEEN
ncbi:MAG: hypothetical protein AB8B78_06085 [Polaribacter sp.]